jgi:YegS/Rv2252/BmrU family lipid kinase
MPRIALLANPDSGDGGAQGIAGLLEARGARVSTFALDQRAQALNSEADRIAVAGGDGSIASAAEVARDASVPLAVIPVGTANDFARSLGLPRESDAAAELAVRGTKTKAVDLGDADGRPFVNAASAGLSPIAAREARGLKRALGPLAYAVGALRAGLAASPVECRIHCDGRERFAGPAWQAIVGVTGAFGGGAEVDADPTDGILDVAVIEANSRARLILHAYGMRSGGLERQRGVALCSGRTVEVELDRARGFNVDGELVDAAKLRLTVDAGAFEVVVA